MFEQVNKWWHSITEREQKLTLASLLAIFIALVYFSVWQPIADNLAASELKLKNAQQTLHWVEVNANKLVASGTVVNKVGEKQNLAQLISSTAKRRQIDISRIQGRQNSVNLLINQVEFNEFVAWMTSLQNQHQIQILTADLSKDKVPGMIKVNRLSLSY
ncbi:type II secretion system protein M [Psychromonas aquatilis]|uniref:Type II secretion system protein M n=1 Tax=Psychromonas aquatilis TaxID=2005072 RepID=A0ABU9GPF2_9GAMM